MLCIDYSDKDSNAINLDLNEIEFLLKNISNYMSNFNDDKSEDINILNLLDEVKIYNDNFLLLGLPDLKFYGKEIISLNIYKHFLSYINYYNGYEEGFKVDLVTSGKSVLDYKLKINMNLKLSEQNKKVEDFLCKCEYLAGEHIIRLSDKLKSKINIFKFLESEIFLINNLFQNNGRYSRYFTMEVLKCIRDDGTGFESKLISYYRELNEDLEHYVKERIEKKVKDVTVDKEELISSYEYLYSILTDIIKLYYLSKVIILNESAIRHRSLNNNTSLVYTSDSWFYLLYIEISKMYKDFGINILSNFNNNSPLLRYGLDKDIERLGLMFKEDIQSYSTLSKLLNIRDDIKDDFKLLDITNFIYYLFLIKGYKEYSRYVVDIEYDGSNYDNKLDYEYIGDDGETICLTICYNVINESNEYELFIDYLSSDILKYPSLVGAIISDFKSAVNNLSSVSSKKRHNGKRLQLVDVIKNMHILNTIEDFFTTGTYELNYDLLKLKDLIKKNFLKNSYNYIKSQFINIMSSVIINLVTSIPELSNMNVEFPKKNDIIVDYGFILEAMKDMLKTSVGDMKFELNYNDIEIMSDKIVVVDNILDIERIKNYNLYLDYKDGKDVIADMKDILVKHNYELPEKVEDVVSLFENEFKYKINVLYNERNYVDLKMIHTKITLKVLVKILVLNQLSFYKLTLNEEDMKYIFRLICDILLMMLLRDSNIDKDFSMFYESDYLDYYIYDIDYYMNEVFKIEDIDISNKSKDIKIYNRGYDKMRLFYSAFQIAYIIYKKGYDFDFMIKDYNMSDHRDLRDIHYHGTRDRIDKNMKDIDREKRDISVYLDSIDSISYINNIFNLNMNK